MVKFNELQLEEITLTNAEYDELITREHKLYGQCEYLQYCLICLALNAAYFSIAWIFSFDISTMLMFYMPVLLLCMMVAVTKKDALKAYSQTVRGAYGKVVFLDNKGKHRDVVLAQGKEYKIDLSDEQGYKDNSLVGRNYILIPYRHGIIRKCLIIPCEERE